MKYIATVVFETADSDVAQHFFEHLLIPTKHELTLVPQVQFEICHLQEVQQAGRHLQLITKYTAPTLPGNF